MKCLKFLLAILLMVNAAGAQPIISTRIIPLKYETQKDTLRIPVASDKYPALKKALAAQITANGDELQSILKNYKSCGCGITGIDYKVTFKNKNVISLILYFETEAAYPNNYRVFRTFNINTGELYPLGKEINQKGLDWVFANYRKVLMSRISTDPGPDSLDAYSQLKAGVDSLTNSQLFGNYVFTSKGIKFTSAKVLPHVIAALEPVRDWLVPYEKLRAFYLPGALAK